MAKIEPKPTEYRGTLFRSRLEARWAAFFDLVEWKWIYEPFELNYYIPDFALIGKDQTVLVEVKPYFSLEEFKKNGIIKRVIDAAEGTEHSDKEFLFLGNCLPKSKKECWDEPGVILGYLYERYDAHSQDQMSVVDPKYHYEVDEALFNNYDGLDFQAAMGSYARRMDGLYSGDGFVSFPSDEYVEKLFNMAGTMVRYNHSVK